MTQPLAIVRAPAKINLALHVTGQLPGGYHRIETLVVFAQEADVLTLEPGGRPAPSLIGLVCEGPFSEGLEADERNLVLRAARAFLDRTGWKPGRDLRFRLEKNLPVASGIGGGSSDAAAALIAMARLSGINDPDVLHSVAAGLGADVPMCLARAPLLASGIGERIETISLADRLELVLVNPGTGVSTQEVFRRLSHKENPPLEGRPEPGRLIDWLGRQRNDLEAPAIFLAPVIGQVLDQLAVMSGCLLARMSGSGATCFGLFDSRENAQDAAIALAADNPGWWARATSLFDDHRNETAKA